jgi:DNA-binding Lrp family transcriptional regulator
MVFSCILFCCETGKSKEVVGKLKKSKGVRRVFSVHGRWDLAAEIETVDLKALGETVLKFHGLSGVRATETLIGF